MARGKQLLQMVSLLRDEVGRANSVATGLGDLDMLKATIRRVYETLHEDYDWPHLRTEFDKITTNNGQRYYDFPTSPAAVNYDRVEQIFVWYSGLPHRLERGIDIQHYATFDSTLGRTSEPALRWDVRFTGTKEQIEIWPIPASDDMQIQMIGFPQPKTLTNDADTLDLDHILVVLFAAAEILARQKSADAQAKLQQAQARYIDLKARSKSGISGYRMGMGSGDHKQNWRAVVRVR